jgi:hypothetical protein
VAGSCEQGIERSGSLKFWEILGYKTDWQLLKKTKLHGVS